jgi:hypothetical protein
VALWAASLLFAGSPALSQSLTSLHGNVTDPSGAAIPNATVHLINSGNSTDRTTTADQRGGYSFTEVIPGTYRLEAEAPGFENYEQDKIDIAGSIPAVLDVKLIIKEVRQNVTVQGQDSEQCLAAQARVLPEVGLGLRALRRGPSGNYYVLTAPGAAAAIYSPEGKRVGQIPASSSPDASIAYGSDLQVDSVGRVYIADRAANAIKIYSANGSLIRKIRVPVPISVEPISEGEVAVSSLFSEHLVDVYDALEGQVYRSFGEVSTLPDADCDPRTLRCTIHTTPGDSKDASHLTGGETTKNRSWFYGDPAGNVYVNLADSSSPTIRKYDAYGYLAYESAFQLNRSASGSDSSDWSVKPEVRLAGVGTIGESDYGSQAYAVNSAGDPTTGSDPRMSGGRPTMGGGGMRDMEGGGGMPGGMHGGGMHGGGMQTNRMGFGIRITQHGGSSGVKAEIEALGVDPTTEDVWAAIGGDLVHFDKDGKLAGYYCLSSGDQSAVKPTTLLVEPNRILVGTDPFGIFQYARPDKPSIEPAASH